MNVLALDAVLLFVLGIPLVMLYRILPVEGTPHWLFGVIFGVTASNILFSLYPPKIGSAIRERIKNTFFWATIFLILGSITWTAIVDRHKTAPIYGVHDIILQQEAAIRFMIVGKNPYKETYFETPMKDWHYGELGQDRENPALYHFVMPPWYLLFPFAFYFVTTPLLGYFDGRMVLLFCLVGTLLIIMRWFKDKQLGRVAAGVLALAPGIAVYFVEGRSDVFALFWFVWAVYLLDKKSWLWSSVLFGLSLMSKQTIWFAVPFYYFYMYATNKHNLRQVIAYGMVTLVICGLLVGPFILWDAKAFIESVLLYLNGGTPTGYPVSGYGLGMVLYDLGIIQDTHAYYPFWLWQLAVGLPVTAIAVRFMLAKPRISRLFVGYAISLLGIWYVSRYFNNSHVSYVGTLLWLAVMKDWDERHYEEA